jgi:hypothetical protein
MNNKDGKIERQTKKQAFRQSCRKERRKTRRQKASKQRYKNNTLRQEDKLKKLGTQVERKGHRSKAIV